LITVVSLNKPTIISTEALSTSTTVLATCGALVASMVAFYNPMNRWVRLKSAALALDSEIWKFRTRTGVYKVDINSFNNPMGERMSEKRLHRYLEEIKQTVSKQISWSPLVTDDSLPKAYYYHGQYSKICDSRWKRHRKKAQDRWNWIGVEPPWKWIQNDEDGQEDDHHSPVEPQDYLKYRVYILLQVFRHRNPKYGRWHTGLETLLILGQMVGVILGVFGKGSWTGIVASVSATITAWSAARNFKKKRERTASAVETLDSLLLWWRVLQFFDRSNVENVNQLVNMCEAVFERQRDAWVATSVAANMEIQELMQSATARATELMQQERDAGLQ